MLTLRATVERVAVITDIHANLPALEAVLEALERTDVDAVYCGGDLVGYGPHPNEVRALIETRGIPTIYGNYDYAIARDLEDCGCAYRDRHDRELGQRSVEWTLAHTDRHSKDFMRGLPFDLGFELGGQCVRQVHGSPRKVNEYYPTAHELHMRWTADAETDRLLGCQIADHRAGQVAKRIDTTATAIFADLTIDQLSDLDPSYSPPFGSGVGRASDRRAGPERQALPGAQADAGSKPARPSGSIAASLARSSRVRSIPPWRLRRV